MVSEMDGLLLTAALNPAELGTALQGAGLRQQGLLNQFQESSTKSVLPAAIQSGPVKHMKLCANVVDLLKCRLALYGRLIHG